MKEKVLVHQTSGRDRLWKFQGFFQTNENEIHKMLYDFYFYRSSIYGMLEEINCRSRCQYDVVHICFAVIYICGIDKHSG